VLSSGLRIRVERHEIRSDRVLLYFRGGVTDIPAESVMRFEEVEAAASTPPSIHETAGTSSAPDRSSMGSDNAAPAPRDARELLRDAANRSGLPAAFVESVAKVESALHPDAVSPKGAIGVMQLTPDTARALHADPGDVAQNIEGGVRLLRELLLRYDGDVVKALAAYNAGIGAVSRYGGLPPYPETQNYVDKVLRTYISAGGR